MKRRLIKHLVGALSLVLVSLCLAVPAGAAPAQSDHNTCVNHKEIDNWHSEQRLQNKGFFFDIEGSQASMTFDKDLLINLASNSSSSAYTASRITEVDSNAAIDDRIKCWQPTDKKDVVVEFRVRFDRAAPPPDMTENLILWNAPLPAKGSSESAKPFTSFGVSRNSFFGGPMYVATIAEDLTFASPPSGSLLFSPMPSWLDAHRWHTVRITVSQTNGLIEVAQGDHGFTTVLQAQLHHTPEPLAFELSLDNEVFPGFTAPVIVADGLEVDSLDIKMNH